MKLTNDRTDQKIIFTGRQKLLMIVFALATSVAAKAQTQADAIRAIDYNDLSNGQTVEYVDIRGDVSIVLTNALGTNILLRGNNKDIGAVRTTVKNGRLEINAERGSFSKLTVYLNVNDIHSLVVTGNAQILSSGISVDNLEIILNGDSFVEVHHQGKLRIIPGDGYELADLTSEHKISRRLSE